MTNSIITKQMIRMIMIIPKTLNNFFISALSLGELLITRFIIHQVYSYSKLTIHLVYIRIVIESGRRSH